MQRYVYVILIAALLVLFFWYSARVQGDFYLIVEFLKRQAEANPLAAVVFFVGLGAASATLSPLSSIPLVPPAILIWGQGITFALLLLGWLLGGVITYLIGSYGVNPVIRKFIDVDGKMAYYESRIPRRAAFWLVLLFRLALPAEIPGYVLGGLRYDFPKYITATFLSELVFAVGAIYGGQAVIDKQPYILGFTAVLLTAVFMIAFYFFSRIIKKHRARGAEPPPEALS